MSRWSPDSRDRLEQAAYDFFLDRGCEQTNVADIAKRAGLTKRTFFRHDAGKPEILFDGTAVVQHELLQAINGLPPAVPAVEAVRITAAAASSLMHRGRALPPAIKSATLTGALAPALQARWVSEPAASLAADMGMAVFYVGFGRWLDAPTCREFVEIVLEGFGRLKAVAAGE